ncbi:MAG: hypothetical protein H0U62_14335 [Actinobacteria bacterium]|nr:hypothetical protein [Actinomycetota bacterium]
MLELLRDTRAAGEPTGPVAQPVQPQARRQGLQRRLNEQERTLAMRICKTAGLNPAGCKFALRSGTGASTDLQAAIMTVHRAVNDFLGIPPGTRRDLTMPDLDRVLPSSTRLGTPSRPISSRRWGDGGDAGCPAQARGQDLEAGEQVQAQREHKIPKAISG